jgi:large subunit ribosomal protein L10
MRIEKKAIIDEVRGHLEKSPYIIVVDYTGMQVVQFNDLRRRLAQHGAGLHVVKNTLLQRAAQGLPLAVATEKLVGPVAVVVNGDGMESAREMKKFNQDNKKPVVNCGFFEGRLFSPAEFEALVNLPPRQVLYGMLAGTLAAPMSQLVGVLHQKLASILYVLKAVQEKKN